MLRVKSLSVFVLVVFSSALAACGEAPTPAEPVEEAPAFAHVPGQQRLAVLERGASLAATRSATATIGAEGGTIEVGDVRLVVPAGALDEPVDITVTVPAGRLMQAKFEPHGLTFNEDVTIEWSVEGVLKVKGKALQTANERAREVLGEFQGVYFEGELGAGAVAEEFFPVTVGDEWAGFKTGHFSGYCLATG